jgi:CRISPR system Cascade subunit CasE
MYMTRIILKRLPAPNNIHAILSAAFPGKRSDQANESLWRIDSLGEARVLIIVSKNSPDTQQIVSRIGVNSNKNSGNCNNATLDKTLDYIPFLKQIQDGQIWKFRLCANPVEHKKGNPNDERGKIFALHTVDEQLVWLNKQSAKYGFNVKGCTVIGDSWIVFNKVRIRAVTFDGLLAITDAEAFRTALTNGIGRGKAYGCGLLTVARVQS